MTRAILTLLLFCAPLVAADPPAPRPLKVPPGFTVTRVAAPPLVDRPIVADFDEKGFLYVADSSGSNEKPDVQLKNPTHRIVRLESTKKNGTFDKATVFADKMMFPEGLMYYRGSVYVAAPPHIWKLTDTDGDGKADKRDIWYDGKTLTGCANDLHGPYRGPDGWIYWTKGAFAKQEHTLPNGQKWSTKAAHIFRAKPDGSGLEPVMTGGMDNPVDVVFTPDGERIFSTTFFQHPANGQRDGLVHAVYGGVYGKDHDPAREHPMTSPQYMPVLTHLGPAAPAGLHRMESNQFGDACRFNLFCCQFNLRTVSRHTLVPDGATFFTKDEPFVTSDDLDFHPTDVIEDADGSLLVIDTGGWYKLCCPSSQLVKTDVLGGIYRVTKDGAHKQRDPRGVLLDWDNVDTDTLTYWLDDSRPAVRRRAADTLIARGEKGISALASMVNAKEYTPDAWREAVWALAVVDHPKARAAARQLLKSGTRVDLVITACHCASLWRDKAAVEDLIALLRSGNQATKRAAAEALGRIGDARAVPAILAVLDNVKNDRVLDHSLTYAMIEISDVTAVREGLKSPSPLVRRAALAALDAMSGKNLTAEDVLKDHESSETVLQDTAWWIASKHPDWGDQVAPVLIEQFNKLHGKSTEREIEILSGRLAVFMGLSKVQDEIVDALRQGDQSSRVPPDRKVVGLRAIGRSKLKTIPTSMRIGIEVQYMSRFYTDEVVKIFHSIPCDPGLWKELQESRFRYAVNEDTIVRLTRDSIAPVGSTIKGVSDSGIYEYVKYLEPTQPETIRTLAVKVILRAAPKTETLEVLAKHLHEFSPADLARLLPAFEKSKDDAVGLALVKALQDRKVRPAVRLEQVKPILDKYGPKVQEAAKPLYAAFAADRAGETAKLETLVKELPAGDVRRGQVVFHSQKAACATCHKIGYVGGTIGPDLTKIGGPRSERDLLESIVFPSASFVRSYEPVKVTTKDGRTVQGILKKDAPDEVVITVSATEEVRIQRTNIEEVKPGSVSVMPAGLDQQLSKQDLADLVAFLKANK